MDGIRLSLCKLNKLAEDVNVYNPPEIVNGFTGITLAYNLDSKEAVDEMYTKVQELGGNVEHAPEKAKDWNGYHFYFKDFRWALLGNSVLDYFAIKHCLHCGYFAEILAIFQQPSVGKPSAVEISNNPAFIGFAGFCNRSWGFLKNAKDCLGNLAKTCYFTGFCKID